MKEDLRIVFMGTPEFAVPSLRILVENRYNVVGVITAPDKPSGRGRKMRESDVKRYALEEDLKILQPTNLKDPDFQKKLKSLNANLQIVVAFRMLPESVWNMPELGTYNLHASLLPAYRGAAPINWALINGETKTGVTTFKLKHQIDTGSILFQKEVEILPTDNAGDLHDKLMSVGSELVLKTVKAIESGDYELKEQDMSGDYPRAPKIFRSTAGIDFSEKGESIIDLIRGLSPYPAAWTMLDGKLMKIYHAEFEPVSHQEEEGTPIFGKHSLKISCADGFINLLEVQLEGKRRHKIKAFLRGYSR